MRHRHRQLRHVSLHALSGETGHSTSCAKYPECSEQQLTSVAGSLRNVSPEVLNQKEHSKPVDLWSIGYCCLLPIIDVAMECRLFVAGPFPICSSAESDWIYTFQIRRHEGSRMTDDRSEESPRTDFPRSILEERVRRRYVLDHRQTGTVRPNLLI